MDEFTQLLAGYQQFKAKYVMGKSDFLKNMAHSQTPKAMVVACCDARVDPAILLQCQPGDLFVVRNVANIIPPYEHDPTHHGTSAALEFGLCYLNIPELIILGHSHCGGISATMNPEQLHQDDFLSCWVDVAKPCVATARSVEEGVKNTLAASYQNALAFPWIKTRVENNSLKVHAWFFDIATGQLYDYDALRQQYHPL